MRIVAAMMIPVWLAGCTEFEYAEAAIDAVNVLIGAGRDIAESGSDQEPEEQKPAFGLECYFKDWPQGNQFPVILDDDAEKNEEALRDKCRLAGGHPDVLARTEAVRFTSEVLIVNEDGTYTTRPPNIRSSSPYYGIICSVERFPEDKRLTVIRDGNPERNYLTLRRKCGSVGGEFKGFASKEEDQHQYTVLSVDAKGNYTLKPPGG